MKRSCQLKRFQHIISRRLVKTRFIICLFAISQLQAASFLIEAEQFTDKGGWGIDTQFIESMGSSYLIAHGMGKAVGDARTEVEVPEAGEYRVWVRTIDWTKRLERPESAGRFQISIDGE
jgi:hypothetical protein